MTDQPIDKLLTVSTEDSLSVVDAYTLVDGLAEMVRLFRSSTVSRGLDPLSTWSGGNSRRLSAWADKLAAELLDKLEPKPKEKDDVVA